MEELLQKIFTVVHYVLYAYFALTSFYIFVYAVAGLFPMRTKKTKDDKKRKFAVLIPGYKEDEVIVEVCEDALKQDYPNDLYEVVAICDSYKSETLEALRKLPIKVIEVSFDKSTKAKALNKAMEVLGDGYDAAVILDADNLMADDFLTKINRAFQTGYIAVQGHRVAKNMDTNFAILDAISEEINNNILRKGTRNLGFSSAIIGSGMAFDYAFFKNIMKDVRAIGGFDKEIDLKMCRQGVKIEYIDDALCYDEKVQNPEVFQTQRRRWISAQITYFKRFFFQAFLHMFTKGNFDFFNKAFHTFLPPRMIFLGFISFVFAVSLLFLPHPFAVQWVALFALVFVTFAIAVPRKFYNKTTFLAVTSLPKGIVLMILSLFKLRDANKKFLHTKHSSSGQNLKKQ